MSATAKPVIAPEALIQMVHAHNCLVLACGATPVDYCPAGETPVGGWIFSRLPDGSRISLQVLRWLRRADGRHTAIAWWPCANPALPEGLLFAAFQDEAQAAVN